MVRSKPASSKGKKPKRGVDFKKYKRKVGRKLPPPKNATNTQIKSKAIILSQQSVALERAGLAVNKKGLTLRELLQQTSHHNAKIRKAALTGIKDLVGKYPTELKLHRLVIIEKLRERICDNDRGVRETLYQLLKTVIIPSLKEDITGPIISLLMAYIFNAMTHMAVDIRLMAFKYFELLVLSYPSSFTLYAEKVLDNYADILRNYQIYLQDKSKLKNALCGLVHCLSLLASKKGKDERLKELNQDVVERRHLHTYESEVYEDNAGISSIYEKLKDLVPILINCFQESTSLVRAELAIDAQSYDCISCTLQCIKLVVEMFVREIKKHHVGSRCSPLLLSDRGDGDVMRNNMLVHLKKLWEAFPIGQIYQSTEMEDDRYFILNVRVAEIFLHLGEWMDKTTFLTGKFLEFAENLLRGKVGANMVPNKVLVEKHLGSVLPLIPGLLLQVMDGWKTRLLEAFTCAFKDCKKDSKLCAAYLSAIEELLLPIKFESKLSLTSNYPELLGHQIAWLQELPGILLQLGDTNSSVTKVVLKLLLQIGQSSPPSSPLALEYNYLQWPLREFYSIKTIHQAFLVACYSVIHAFAGTTQYGPFVKLPNDCQELAMCHVYYFVSLSSDFIESLTSCCLYENLEPSTILRMVEVLHSAYKAGHVQISDQISFLVTIVAKFRVFPEKSHVEKDGKASTQKIFKSLTSAVFRCLSQMGDNFLVLKLLCRNIFHEISLKPPLDNMHGLLKLTVALDTRPLKLSEDYVNSLSKWIFGYMVDAACYVAGTDDLAVLSDQIRIFQYYIQPCNFLFCGSDKLLFHVLELLGSFIMEDSLLIFSRSDVKYALEPSNRVHAVTSIIIWMYNDARLHRNLSTSKAAIKNILVDIRNLLDSSQFSITLEERHKIRAAFDRLKTRLCELQFTDTTDMEGV